MKAPSIAQILVSTIFTLVVVAVFFSFLSHAANAVTTDMGGQPNQIKPASQTEVVYDKGMPPTGWY